jgi:hypothetical protein
MKERCPSETPVFVDVSLAKVTDVLWDAIAFRSLRQRLQVVHYRISLSNVVIDPH